jgi:hypothetical protein
MVLTGVLLIIKTIAILIAEGEAEDNEPPVVLDRLASPERRRMLIITNRKVAKHSRLASVRRGRLKDR